MAFTEQILMEIANGIFKGGYNMSDNFLYKEYELCFNQLQFYDNRQINLIKYLITITSSVATALFALYKFLEEPTQEFYLCQTFLTAIIFIVSVLIYLSMLQNRLYFVFVARQLNAIRKFFLENETSDFKDNQLYTSTDFPAIKHSSVHSLLFIGATILSSLFAGASIYSFLLYIQYGSLWWIGILGFIVLFGIEFGGGVAYLTSSGKKSADDAIHNN